MTIPNIRGILRGVAYGDAWGYPNEFHSYETLTAADPRGPEMPAQLIVSDDTQMMLYLAQALNGTPADEIVHHITENFVAWMQDPDNDRAPGNTCMTACRALSFGTHWRGATVAYSDGCGAIMRVAPAAFLPDGLWQPVAAVQAAITHGAPVAIAASLVSAALLRGLIVSNDPARQASDGLLRRAILFTELDRLVVAAAPWLVDHPHAYGSVIAAEEMLRSGMAELRVTLTVPYVRGGEFCSDPWSMDPCDIAGEGWRSQHALAAALFCVDLLRGEPIEALRRAATTGGDSDSIAAIAGMFLGAIYGDVWPAEWFDRLEPRYREWITAAETYDFSGVS